MTVIQNIKDWLDKPARAPRPKVAAFFEMCGAPTVLRTRGEEIAGAISIISSVVTHIAFAIAHALSTLLWIIVSAIVLVWVATHYPLTNPLVDYCLSESASFLRI